MKVTFTEADFLDVAVQLGCTDRHTDPRTFLELAARQFWSQLDEVATEITQQLAGVRHATTSFRCLSIMDPDGGSRWATFDAQSWQCFDPVSAEFMCARSELQRQRADRALDGDGDGDGDGDLAPFLAGGGGCVVCALRLSDQSVVCIRLNPDRMAVGPASSPDLTDSTSAIFDYPIGVFFGAFVGHHVPKVVPQRYRPDDPAIRWVDVQSLIDLQRLAAAALAQAGSEEVRAIMHDLNIKPDTLLTTLDEWTTLVDRLGEHPYRPYILDLVAANGFIHFWQSRQELLSDVCMLMLSFDILSSYFLANTTRASAVDDPGNGRSPEALFCNIDLTPLDFFSAYRYHIEFMRYEDPQGTVKAAQLWPIFTAESTHFFVDVTTGEMYASGVELFSRPFKGGWPAPVRLRESVYTFLDSVIFSDPII